MKDIFQPTLTEAEAFATLSAITCLMYLYAGDQEGMREVAIANIKATGIDPLLEASKKFEVFARIQEANSMPNSSS